MRGIRGKSRKFYQKLATEVLTYVDWELYAYSKEAGTKITRMAHWLQVEKSSGIQPKGLKEKPEKPENASYIFDLYSEIKKGAEKVGYREIQAYQDVTGDRLSRFESSVILQIDILRREHARRHSKASHSD